MKGASTGSDGTPTEGPDVDDMAVFVDRLAAAGSDRSTVVAAAQIRRRIDAGAVPPGIRKLAEALVASASQPPAPRRPVDEPGSVVAAMDVRNLVVLADHGPENVATAVGALLAAGRRVVVTATAPADLDAVRAAVPADVADRTLTGLPAVSPADLRELRRLLVTDTPERRARPAQQLPAESALPAVARVAELCRQLLGVHGPGRASLLDELLTELEPDRLAAITGVARCLRAKLGALGPRHHRSWTWDLLSDLLYQRRRSTFDRLRMELAQATETANAIQDTPPVAFVEPLTDEGIEALFDYLAYFRSGRRSRAFFRAIEQREVQPVLAQIRVAGQVPATATEVELVLRHRELAERMGRIEAYCAELGVPALCDAGGLGALLEDLEKVAAASRSMAALRHDVLFLREDSPIPPPDATNALQLAMEILAFTERAPAGEAAEALDALADELAAVVPVPAISPEHAQAVEALRARDTQAYAVAVDALGAARRQRHDSQRQARLLGALRAAAPTLAAAWTARGTDPAGFGVACFTPIDALLAVLPPPDSADVVLVLGASTLGVERLLLTAVAPRMVAVVAPGGRSDVAPSLLTVLRKARALVIRADAVGARVVAMPRPAPTPRAAHAG